MTRRIVRTMVQLAAATFFAVIVIFFLDRNFRVLPTAMHGYLPQHHNGMVVTDLTIAQCSSVNPFSSCQLDPERWHRVEKDLFLGRGWVSSAYLHVARKKEEELALDAGDRVVVDVQVGRLDPSTGTKGEADERWEARPAGLWVKRAPATHKATDSQRTVTAVDVLFGDDAVEVRPGWQVAGTPLLLDVPDHRHVPHLSVRRGSQHAPPARPQPRIKDNGRFKILQVSDMHLSTGAGDCRDALPEGRPCEADRRTLDFVAKIVDQEKPDLVVLSGDQVNGDSAPDAQSAIFKYAQVLIERKVPYVSIFGNHDDEKSLPRAAQMSLIEQLPYSLSEAGPADVDGVGNYYVEVLARKSDHSALTLYLLDSHSYSPDERRYHGYDWIKPSQIEWFRKTAQGLKKAHREYTHIHMDLAFIHIPLPEYRDKELYRKGAWKEGVTAPNYNSGFRDALVEQNVLMVSCGHDHVNEYCALSTDDKGLPALWMCYAGGSGFGGYGGYGGYHRRVRVFDIDTNEARVRTWKRVEYGDEGVDKRIDEQIIVDAGRPVGPPPGEEAS